jgi:beta-glucosidase
MSTFGDARKAVAAGMPASDAAQQLVEVMTPEERLWCLDGDAPTWAGLAFLGKGGYHRAPFYGARVERLGLPGIAFSDGPRGAVIGNATCFPVAMARGATWDPDLEERVGEAIGRELRASGATLTGALCVNVLRHPAWGRAQETYGEDPHHVAELGVAFMRGLQRHVMACVKHFACNSMENARFSVDIKVDEVALHEIYLPHFRRIIEEGVASVMSAYNSLNGEWCGQNEALLTDILRAEWGFEGFVISDWIFGLRDAATSLATGLDIEMPYRMIRAQHLGQALERGDVSWTDVDRAVLHLVSTLLRFDEVLSAPAPPAESIGCSAHRALAREVAARSVVLLRNEPVGGHRVLPISSDAQVALIGKLAESVNTGDGGSSEVWDLANHTIAEGFGSEGIRFEFDDGSDLARATDVAARADVAVVVVGYTYLDEGEFIGDSDPALGQLFPPSDEPAVAERFAFELSELPAVATPEWLKGRPRAFGVGGDRGSLRLHHSDVALIEAVSRANPKTVVVIQGGSAVIMTEWIDTVPAVVLAWYGGCEAGASLADVLWGRVNPSARLPFSVPLDEADLPAFDRFATTFTYERWHGWWHLEHTGRRAAYPFGFGLSYTTFALDGVEVSLGADAITVRGVVRNTGDRAGADVAQVYAQLPDINAPRRLVGFSRVEVAERSESAFAIRVPIDRLATRNPEAHNWQLPEGRHHVIVARHVEDESGLSFELEL